MSKKSKQEEIIIKNEELPMVPLVSDLEMKCFILSKINQYLSKQVGELEAKLKHAESLLMSTSKSSPVSKLIISDEEVIADLQIKRLKEAAQIRVLSLEETRQYDLYVKNKRLIQGDATNVIDHKPLSNSKEDLIRIAQIVKKD